MYLLELAQLKDTAKYYAIIKAAKEFQREQVLSSGQMIIRTNLRFVMI